MRILGIETSCDETGIAVYDDYYGLMINKVFSQVDIHNKFGGIIPEIASREHLSNIFSLVKNIFKKKNDIKNINAIAYTAGPGLVGSLLVGATFSSSLAYSLNIPTIIINHMEAHLLSVMMENRCPIFPFLTLLVSGKHTEIIYAHSFGKYSLLGKSIDDAAGEAFDKISKNLNLNYPGGPEISKISKFGVLNKYVFPKPMIQQKNLNFSFSGLKTSVINFINKKKNLNFQFKADVAKAFEQSITDVLVSKCETAIKIKNINRLVVSGGVSANKELRRKLQNMIKKYQGEVFFSRPEFCTDNGAMIAYTGMLKFKLNQIENDYDIKVFPKWKIYE
ncbi:tRNA (adenosine(37)-N6)-threonylcarbamoyltransferase complex transferase subunit TsaD [Buchnera aphidicola]|uniref:tRNA (adenosine(37)-N6)-threonylcarbamoyltransferase complex transferase subunit TsaD n=1 Tax=Buchnera aphidicola TaxID=9 RepID=UPI002237262A|nr:tRNA (adenosine(37)-N6)-threonylcarbamoyltransferase complex transferase subunit TsaD [Buchnera aphidicola]MCW5197380.1 tRNA (adenosine(37)-N6)-threonylcarbamoyltransferase complex transferase subunit TsaD [Buchnera aphidicola (Chaitophorus viminalis)]